jgi:class 3 adenylate cyclase
MNSGPSDHTAAPTGSPDEPGPAAAKTDSEALMHLRHELRTPLNQILGYTEMLLEIVTEHGQHKDLIADLGKLRCAGDEINTLLGYSLVQWKIESGQVDLADYRHRSLVLLDLLCEHRDSCEQQAAGLKLADVIADLQKISLAAGNLRRQLAHDFFTKPGSAISAASPEPAPAPGTKHPFAGPDTALFNCRLLIVDDQEMNREMLLRRLFRMGYDATVAEDGKVALELMNREQFDLVLLDIMMPVMDGFETLTRIKADLRLRHIPVIMLTAVDEPASTVRCIEGGAEDYVPKPFNPVILRARINASLEKKRLRDMERAYMAEIQTERAKSEHLLLNILPKAVSERLKSGEKTIVNDFAQATVLFADIVGFTRIAAENPAVDTVNLLNEIFSAFDQLLDKTGVEKIKTIGDSYMVVSGVPIPQSDHALRAARMALGILQTLHDFNTRHSFNWSIRIGMHSGPLVAGIIGSKKFAYDLWGDTVNIASRLESQGEPDVIQISAATADLLRPYCELSPRGQIDLKNRGRMMTYQVLRLR